jgi:uncharacterized protein YdiU (UPF0061 family)
MRDTLLPGAILTRIASSHIRVGTFEYVAHREDKKLLKLLADYTIRRHFPHIADSENPYLDLLSAVMDMQITLVIAWLRVGFIHGVMNTDNMAISGETIDYGPCAFMDGYDPATVFSSIDRMGRYSYAKQPPITRWNLARLADTLLPLIHDDTTQAMAMAEDILQLFDSKFQKQWFGMMRRKLGLHNEKKGDEKLIAELLQWMQSTSADYTNTFCDLISNNIPEGEIYQAEAFQNWWRRWQHRLQQNDTPLESALCLMRQHNPAIIPRNHNVAAALYAAEEHADFTKMHTLVKVLENAYMHNDKYSEFCQPPKPAERVYQTFCGT